MVLTTRQARAAVPRQAIRGLTQHRPCVRNWRASRNGGCGGSHVAGHGAGSGGWPRLREASADGPSATNATQPKYLPSSQTHQRRGRFRRKPTVRQIDHHTQPGQFPIAHLGHRHCTSLPPSGRQHVPVTFLSGTGVTFLSGADIRLPHNVKRFSLGGAAHRSPRGGSAIGIRAGKRKTCWTKPLAPAPSLWALNAAGSLAGACYRDISVD